MVPDVGAQNKATCKFAELLVPSFGVAIWCQKVVENTLQVWNGGRLAMLKKKRPGARLPEFPKVDPSEEIHANNVRLKRGLWDRLRKIGEEQTPKRSMNQVIEFFLEFACDDYEQAKARKKKP
jgi:hypothetical protein